jgi:hypothetical protein
MIYVTNIGDATVKIYDKDGHFISKFGQLGDLFGEFTRPKGIAVDKDHRIFVVDGGFQNVQLFNENHRLLMFFGDPPLPAGALDLPASIDVTTDNLDYFQQFAAPDFVLDEVVFVTNQMGSSMVSIYGLGHKKGTVPASSTEEPKQPEGAPKGGEKKPAPGGTPTDGEKKPAPEGATKPDAGAGKGAE